MADMIHVPTSTDDLIPSKPANLNIAAENFIRSHYEEVVPIFQMISGEAASKHDDLGFDEADGVFQLQRLVAGNGYDVLAQVSTKKFWLAIRRGYKKVTGQPVHLLDLFVWEGLCDFWLEHNNI